MLDIGGQDTKAIQVDDQGIVTAFQMNDRCAAGCGRYLGYIADELNLGLHELGPLALQAARGRADQLDLHGLRRARSCASGSRSARSARTSCAGLHRAIMLRAMSLLARSGGVDRAAHLHRRRGRRTPQR